MKKKPVSHPNEAHRIVSFCFDACLLNSVYVRSTPHPVTVTTRIITFLVGNPYKPSFATVTGWGVDPKYMIEGDDLSFKISVVNLEFQSTLRILLESLPRIDGRKIPSPCHRIASGGNPGFLPLLKLTPVRP